MLPLLTRLHDRTPHARLLSNGRYTVLLTGAGTGFSTWDRLALTAWSADRTEDADGLFLYLRDVERGTLWSVGHQPVQAPAERYAAHYAPGRLTIERLDGEIESSLDVCVAADGDVELRRLRLRNRSHRPRRIEVTSYAEVVLDDPGARAAHPAFSKLFVQTGLVSPPGVLLARRRPRSRTERIPWMCHALAGEGPLQYETDRGRFLGRRHAPARPLALETAAPLSGSAGSVLEPAFCLRRTVELPPGEEAPLTLVLGAAETREAALALAARHTAPGAAEIAFERAREWEHTLLRRLELTQDDAERFQELAGAVLYGDPALRAGADVLRRARGGGAEVLARYGLGAHVVVLHADRNPAAAEDLVKAHAYWRAKQLAVDLLIVSDDPALARHGNSDLGVVVRRRRDISPADLDCVQALAAAVIAGAPSPAGAAEPEAASRGAAPAGAVADRAAAPTSPTASLLFDNGHGGFAPDGREYVIRVGPGDAGPPMPWVNVIANESFGTLVSESGAGCTWNGNSRQNRLTPWYNDPIVDPYGEALYVRDDSTGTFWSPLPGPVPPSAPFEVRHGFGYSTWRHTSHDLEHEVCIFVPRHEPVKVVRLRVGNRSQRPRRLSLISYARLVLGVLPSATLITERDDDSAVLVAENPLGGEFADGVVFAAAVPPDGAEVVRCTADRTAFLGRNGAPERPAALCEGGALDGATGARLDPCAALQVPVSLAPGATIECAFLLGEARDRAAARAIVARYRQPSALERGLDEARAFWRDTLSAVQVRTPSAALDVMLNGWLPYQTLACRLWARTAFYQSGGAFGFRDQLQDAAALVYARPDLTRAQILLHAAHQFVEGDVLHWWHPPAGRGTRTRFSDDLLWLPYVTAFYVHATGDWGVLDERVGFAAARRLEPGEDEVYLLPSPAAEAADLYAHCCRALDRSLGRGPHGLPLMGTGDWNDGMNRVGREGRGESVWLGFFLHSVLGEFIPLCARRADQERAGRYREHRAGLESALEEAGWDGAWYRRAYYDDGTPLGSATSDECRIDALVQAWAVISGAARRERAERALDAVERELVSEDPALLRLLAPPFDRTAHDPGYIRGYVPGIRENGGQYTQAAVWVVRALAELGRRSRAVDLLEKLGPVQHARNRDAVGVYRVEPYVVAADVYSAPPHVGRGGWTWYTGSAGWMYRVALESVLGLTLEGGDTLRLAPRIPDDWPGYSIGFRLPDGRTRYEIEVRNPRGDARVVHSAMLDGAPIRVTGGVARLPLARDGAVHRARVTLGSPASDPPRRTGAR